MMGNRALRNLNYYILENYCKKNNISLFGDEEFDLIQTIISEGPKHNLPDDDKDKYKAYWKIKWLALIKSVPKFNSMLEHNKTIIKVDEEKIKYKSETIIRSGPKRHRQGNQPTEHACAAACGRWRLESRARW